MNKKLRKFIFAIALISFHTISHGQTPTIGLTSQFALFTSSGAITNVGISQITGDIGSNLGAATNFGNVNGVMRSQNAVTAAAAADLLTLTSELASATNTNFPSASLGNGDTLTAGVYYISTNATLNATLNLNAQGNPNAVFIFKINGTLGTNANAKVNLVNGALACNVFWKVDGAITMATGTYMRGTVIANNAAISMSTGDTLEGRALSTTGAIAVNGVMVYTPIGCGSSTLNGPTAPNLASTAQFTFFSASGPVTNTGTTNVIGDVGTNSGLTTGFDPMLVNGTIHSVPDDSTAACAADLTAVYNHLNGLAYDIELLYPAQFGSNLVLTPHTYLLNAATTFTDTLFLNALGNANAVFVIRIFGALTTSAYANVVLINGAQSKNVYWLVNGAVSVASNALFRGYVIANNGAISFAAGTTLDGRAFSTVGAVNTANVNAYGNGTKIYSQASGDPANLNNWNWQADGSGEVPTNFASVTSYVIQNGHNLSTSAPFSFGAVGSTLQIESGGILTGNHAITIATGAKYQIDNGGIFNVNVSQTANEIVLAGKINLAPSATLTLNGAVTDSGGVISGSATSNLSIGTNVGTILFDQATPGTTNVIQNLTIGTGSNAGLTLGNVLNLSPTGSISFNAAGTKTLTTGGFLTLKSTSSGTAYIGNTNGATISGNYSIERFLPATARKFRFLASPVVGATSVNWRNNGVNTPGVGIQITGVGSNFDLSLTHNPSAFGYNEANAGSSTTVGHGAAIDAGWVAFTDGNTTPLTNGVGFRVLVRGDRTISLVTLPIPAPNPTTISVTGSYPASTVTVNTTKTGSTTNSGFNLVGNPFPSAIDWNAITKTNVSGTYYVYSPVTNAYVSWNGSTGNATQYISSGQAFFVLNPSTNGSIGISESHKVTSAGGAFFKTNLVNHLKVKLNYDSSNSDELFIHFREDATEGQDNFDAPKLVNASMNIASIGIDDKRYNINCLPALSGDREIALSIMGTVAASYFLVFNGVSSFAAHSVYLIDSYLKTNTQVSNGFSYPMQITSDSASIKDGRFKLLIKKSATGLASAMVSQKGIIAYPNPVENMLYLDLNGSNNAVYILFNQLGEEVLKGMLTEEKSVLNTSEWRNGAYFIRVASVNAVQTIKIIK